MRHGSGELAQRAACGHSLVWTEATAIALELGISIEDAIRRLALRARDELTTLAALAASHRYSRDPRGLCGTWESFVKSWEVRSLSLRPRLDGYHLAPAGEFDLSTASMLDAELTVACAIDRDLTLDLTDVVFMDIAGFAPVYELQRCLAAKGRELHIVGGPSSVALITDFLASA